MRLPLSLSEPREARPDRLGDALRVRPLLSRGGASKQPGLAGVGAELRRIALNAPRHARKAVAPDKRVQARIGLARIAVGHLQPSRKSLPLAPNGFVVRNEQRNALRV